MNERYTIRVSNPTPRRVEAVVTVDGLDVVDGESGDLRKRGYIVPPYGEVRIEGFRTSLSNVATFRFSSVDGSYAGQQGKARNVGVIAVAIFEEQAPKPEPQLVIPQEEWRHDLRHRRPAEPTASADRAGESAKVSSRPAPTGGGAPAGAPAPAVSPSRPAPLPRDRRIEAEADFDDRPGSWTSQRTHRPGLGTEFGEQRHSAASFTRFVRAADRPIAIAELRYNDVAGLMALGIPVHPLPDHGELMVRETADPFPGDFRFARAPR
jgi:hypothetical protein